MAGIITTEEVDDAPLGDDQLADITRYLDNLGRQDVTKLGLVLGLQYNTIRNLQDDFLNVVITSWLNKADNVESKGMPSWRALVRGLRDKQVRQNGIAANIARDHHTRGVSNGQPLEKDQSKGQRSIPDGVSGKRTVEDSAGRDDDEACTEQQEQMEMAICLRIPEAERMPVTDPSSDTRSAYILDPGKLWNTPEIKVWFTKGIPNWRYNGEPITKEKILDWANKWSEFDVPGGNPVPKFVPVEEKLGSDIRVEYGDDGACWSRVGTDAKTTDGATMHLDLRDTSGGDDYKVHLVIHEFGHALGLEHEHQSPNAPSFIDEKETKKKFQEDYKKSLKNERFKAQINKRKEEYKCWSDEQIAKELAEETFQRDWEQKSGGEATEYDPYSIMHYWIPKEWLKQGYKYLATESESQLQTEKEREMQRRLTTLAHELSEMDKKTIVEKYRGVKNDQPLRRGQNNGKGTGSGPAPPKSRTAEDFDEPSNSARWMCGGVILSAVLILVVAVIVSGVLPLQLAPSQSEPSPSSKYHTPAPFPTDSPTIHPPPVITDCHRISKKQDLYTELADIGNWEALCSHLEVPEGKIDELVHGNLENIARKERCLAAYVDQGNACWEKVIEVVRGYPFYKNSLATRIAEKYGVGGQG